MKTKCQAGCEVVDERECTVQICQGNNCSQATKKDGCTFCNGAWQTKRTDMVIINGAWAKENVRLTAEKLVQIRE
uniref:Uncharacterized protein n=1 Tax=Acrobeloides nanus TaxID=290746 RepID=A0A914ELF9_9BILA